MDAMDIILRGMAKEVAEQLKCTDCGVDLEIENKVNVKQNWDLYCSKCFEKLFGIGDEEDE